MADIKSSLEIALERAAAMTGDSKAEDDTLEREEGRKQGQALARKTLNGDMDPAQMAAEIDGLGPTGQEEARSSAMEILLEAIPDLAMPALAGLQALDGDTPVLQSLFEALMALQDTVNQLDQEAAQHLAQELADAGISGSAVHPNPAAFTGWEEMAADRLTQPLSALEQAKAAYAAS